MSSMQPSPSDTPHRLRQQPGEADEVLFNAMCLGLPERSLERPEIAVEAQ